MCLSPGAARGRCQPWSRQQHRPHVPGKTRRAPWPVPRAPVGLARALSLAKTFAGGEDHLPRIEESPMAEYIPSPREWVRDQVELYERSGGTDGTTLRDTGLPVIIVTHTGNKTGAIRKTPLMRVKDGAHYVLVGSQGGAPTHPVWVYNLRANPAVEIRDHTVVQAMRVREVKDEAERARLWGLAVAAYPPYADYQTRTTRRIPLFVAEPGS